MLDKLAAKFDFKFSSITADIDEQAIKNDLRGAGRAQELVLALAHAKAAAIIAKLKATDSLVKPGYLVTCDQVRCILLQGRGVGPTHSKQLIHCYTRVVTHALLGCAMQARSHFANSQPSKRATCVACLPAGVTWSIRPVVGIVLRVDTNLVQARGCHSLCLRSHPCARQCCKVEPLVDTCTQTLHTALQGAGGCL